MKKATWQLLPVVLVLVSTSVLAQEHTPVSSITTAMWQDYQDMYQHSPLCSKDEITLWSCDTGEHTYSLCSSQTVTRTSGYMQYRASSRGKVVFTHPAEKKPPLGSFVYKSFPDGNAFVEFVSDGYGYTLVDPLRGESSILVLSPTSSGKATEISCPANQTLQVNYTMRLMYDSGVWTRN